MGGFFSDLKSALGPRMLREVVVGMRRNDLLGLAGQLAYFFLLSFFPFLMFLVSLTGLVMGNPEAGLKGLLEALTGIVPASARTLVGDYVDRNSSGPPCAKVPSETTRAVPPKPATSCIVNPNSPRGSGQTSPIRTWVRIALGGSGLTNGRMLLPVEANSGLIMG